MATPSTDGDSSPSRSAPRDLRDSWIFRLAALLVVLLAAFGVARGCASKSRNVSQDEAVEIAKNATDFDYDRYVVRFLQQGIPPHPVWAVSLYQVDSFGKPTRTQVVLVDAATGEVLKR